MDWKEERLGIFTASKISDLLVTERGGKGFGKSAMTYINAVLAELLTGEQAPEVTTKPIEWGNEWEPVAMAEYRKRFPDKEVVYFGKENPRLFSLAPEYPCGSSPDGLIYDERVIEIKCPYNSSVHIENLGLTPETFRDERKEYFAQIQLNMICTGTNKAHFVSFDPRMIDDELKLSLIEMPKDDDFCKNMINRIEAAGEILRNKYKKLKGK